MKKVLKVSTALVLSLVMVLSMSVLAMAAGSKSDVVEVVKAVDADGADVTVTLGEVSGVPLLTEEIAAEKIGGGVKAAELTVLWQKDITASKLPATLTFAASGVSADQEIYVFHYEGDWVDVEEGKGSTITHTFSDLSPVGLVVRKPANQQTTPGQTDTNTPVPTGDHTSIALWGS